MAGGWCRSWGMMHPTHYTAELLPQRKLMSPPHNDDTQCSVTYDVCTNSKHIGWGRCSLWLFYVGHIRWTGAQQHRKDIFHATHKGSQTMPLRCDFLSQRKSPGWVMWNTSVTLNLWENALSYVFFIFHCEFSHIFSSNLFFFSMVLLSSFESFNKKQQWRFTGSLSCRFPCHMGCLSPQGRN